MSIPLVSAMNPKLLRSASDLAGVMQESAVCM